MIRLIAEYLYKIEIYRHLRHSRDLLEKIKARRLRKFRRLIIAGVCSFFLVQGMVVAQDTTIPDSAYYDFWVGNWHQVIDGEVADEPRFKVTKGLYTGHLIEEWQMEGYKAKAWRGWDSSSESWIFTWVSEMGHYQIWNERKVGDHWYMFKTFTIDGQEILSRQAFIPQSGGTVIRTSEHSKDGGENWTLRFKEIYKKKKEELSTMDNHETIRAYYRSFKEADRETLRNLLTDDFRHISSFSEFDDPDKMLDTIWPEVGKSWAVDLQIFGEHPEFLVRYNVVGGDQPARNMAEYIRFEGDKIAESEVFTGREVKD